MKKFTKVNEEFKEELLRNKIENKTELSINITCDFCDFKEEYKCVNNVANKEERWLAVETFIQNGWNELTIPKEQGIACPICVEKWKEGNWYVKESADMGFDEEEFDEEEFEAPKKFNKIKTIKMIDVDDWDDLVSNTYGRPYSFQQQDGCKGRGIHRITIPSKYDGDKYMNDSVPEIINGERKMGVKFKVWLERDPKEWNGAEEDRRFLNLFWDRNFYPDVNTVANDLYKRGIIDAGDYSIDIDW